MTALQPQLKELQEKYKKRQTAALARHNGSVQSKRRQPHRLPGPPVHPVPHLDRPVPSRNPNLALNTRTARRAVLTPLLLDAGRQRRHTHQQLIPLARPRKTRHFARNARPRRRLYVAHAENHLPPFCRPATSPNQSNDALDDADYVRLLHNNLPQRISPVLDCLQLRRNGNSRLRYRMGTTYRYAKIQTRRTCAGSRRSLGVR